jgi:hypothetical protein
VVSITLIGSFTEACGLIETPLETVFSRMIVAAKNLADDAVMTIPEISRTAPTIRIM